MVLGYSILMDTQTLCPGPVAALGAGRWPWWDWWIDRKTRWVRDEQRQLSEGVFRALAAGTGLPPIHQKSNFAFRSVRDGADRFLGLTRGGERPYARIYTRLGNPTTEYLERVLFQLEAHHVVEKALAEDELEPTIGTLIFSSGMGAVSALFASVLTAGDTVLAGNVYGCTDSLLRGMAKFGVGSVFCDMGNLAAVEAALDEHPNVSLVFLESPENPTLRLADIERISRLTEERGILLAVDNTFCSPYLQQPFRLGADFVLHSLTKYVNGHSTSVGGAVLGPFRFMKEGLFNWYKDLGATPSPFDSWLNSMTVQSLAVRQKEQCRSAALIAGFLRGHPEVAHVHLPRISRFPAGRARPPADAPRRGDHQLRPRRGSPGRREADELLRPPGHPDGARREPGLGDLLHPAPRVDDSFRRARGRPSRPGNHAGADPAIRRARRPRRPDRAPRSRSLSDIGAQSRTFVRE